MKTVIQYPIYVAQLSIYRVLLFQLCHQCPPVVCVVVHTVEPVLLDITQNPIPLVARIHATLDV